MGADTLGFGDFQTENLIRHYRKTDNKYEETMFGATILAGELAVPIAFDFSEPDVVLQFPFTYESKDSSISRLDVDLALTGFDAQLSRNRKRINSVDGYGSLQTSQGFYEDVLRMKTIIYNNDTTTLDSIVIPISTVEVDYKWFSKDHEGPVMVASGFVVNENEVITEVKIRDEGQSSSILALADTKAFDVFPNPTRSHVTIKLSNRNLIDIAVYNEIGMKVYAKRLDQSIFDLAFNHPPGIYFIIGTDDSGTRYQKKLIRY